MTVQVTITIEVDDDIADDEHVTGLTEAGHDKLMDALMSFGTIIDGPNRV